MIDAKNKTSSEVARENLCIARQIEALQKIAQLKSLVFSHLDDSKSWGRAGDLGHVNEQLDELIRFMGGR